MVFGPVRTVVTFQSIFFNTLEKKKYFVHPTCFGDDVCKWLVQKLRGADVKTGGEPLQGDFGWYFNFTVREGQHRCFVSYRAGGTDGKAGLWIAKIEKRCGLLGSIFGRRHRGVTLSAVAAIHRVLAEARETGSVRWHYRKDFEQDREDLATLAP